MKTRRACGKMAWAVLAWGMAAALSGCVVIPYEKKKQHGPPAVTTRTLGVEGEVGFHPEVEREGDVVQLQLVAAGKFVEETTTTRTCKVQKQKLAVGVCPGFADDVPKSMNLFSAFVLVGVRNVANLGVPTLSGLLVEPFLPARESGRWDYAFRRFALVGFSKYKLGMQSVTEKPKSSRRTVAKSQPVEQIALWFDAEPKFWESCLQEGDTLVLRGVEAGRHEGRLYIKSVLPGHVYETELKKMEWVPIDVEIPE